VLVSTINALDSGALMASSTSNAMAPSAPATDTSSASYQSPPTCPSAAAMYPSTIVVCVKTSPIVRVLKCL